MKRNDSFLVILAAAATAAAILFVLATKAHAQPYTLRYDNVDMAVAEVAIYVDRVPPVVAVWTQPLLSDGFEQSSGALGFLAEPYEDEPTGIARWIADAGEGR
jgi:hypothetical protein